MTRTRLVRIVGCVVALVCLIGCRQLDHFLVYDVTDLPTEKWPVKLQGQFDPAPKPATVISITHWANPVGKKHEGSKGKISDPNAHLNWYRIEQPKPEPVRTVRYDNQFGQGSIDIRKALFLLVPAEKRSDPNSKFPSNLDHYKVYWVDQVNTAPQPPVVELKDQFGTLQKVTVGAPVLFCVPVTKWRDNEKPHKIKNKRDHLVGYKLPPLEQRGPVKFKDQFLDFELAVRKPVWLLVPTRKEVVVEHDE